MNDREAQLELLLKQSYKALKDLREWTKAEYQNHPGIDERADQALKQMEEFFR